MVRESGSQQDSLSIRSNEIQDELLELRGGLGERGMVRVRDCKRKYHEVFLSLQGFME